ncbi:MAG: HNH endonuclease [Hyphomonadaceae bacterium]|nr:HNH endonuclease [Hyphomonadaceae bacterium]
MSAFDSAFAPVPGYRCRVSKDGRVLGKTRELDGWLDSDGYRRVNVHDGERFRQIGVHVLVALTYLGPRPTPEHEAAHNDGVRTHNAVTNLRWATARENQRDRDRHGTHNKGTRAAAAKLTDEAVREIRRRHVRHSKGPNSASALAREFGVSHFAIHRVVTGKGWTHVQQGEAT